MPAILIVEDDPHQNLLLQEELREEGYTILSATSAPQALDIVSSTMPDLVVLDLAMPGIDGLDLLGRLLDINNRLPVVIHTAYSSYQDNFMSWAADAYVIKRSDLGELKGTIRGILREPHAFHNANSGATPIA
ncbi:MAG: response regulator [Candidatus Brocadiia bacterium]